MLLSPVHPALHSVDCLRARWRQGQFPQGGLPGGVIVREEFACLYGNAQTACRPACRYCGIATDENTRMSNAIAAHKHRTRLHVLRDRLKRAVRDKKRGLPGAAERVAAHTAKRSAYRAANP
jgi:hypothetical protein